MLSYRTEVDVPALRSREVYDFLRTCDDQRYHLWWPGTHLSFHTVSGPPGEVGSVVFMDERIGTFRLTARGVVRKLVPDRELVVQLTWAGVPLPAWLTLSFEDTAEGVRIVHELALFFRGAGRVLDRLLARLALPADFEQQLAGHAREEFARLGQLLHPRA